MDINRQLRDGEVVCYPNWEDMVCDMIESGYEYYFSYYGHECENAYQIITGEQSAAFPLLVIEHNDGWRVHRAIILKKELFKERILLP